MRAENLQRIRSCGSDIGADGWLALSKANWHKISVINLGKIIFTKAAIKLEMKVVIILRRWVGIWSKLI
jgi:hypothetical protein